MIKINGLTFDPQKDDASKIQEQMDHYTFSIKNKIWFIWKDYSLNQDLVREYYLPFSQYAQSKGHNVYCIMPHDMSKHLVRNKKLMFVDPTFLNEFKFKQIEFTLPFKPKYKPKSVISTDEL